MTMLTPPSEFLAACPKFRVLVLGNPESTKQELISNIFGLDLEKIFVDDAFSASHDIEQELDLHSQNSRVAIHTCLNFGTGDETKYDQVQAFLRSRASPSTSQDDRVHCIWYCVASEEDRALPDLERRFFSGGLHSAAPGVPIVVVFTKYDEFVSRVKHDWSRDADEQGLSKVAVSHILRDLSTKRFEQQIGTKWDEVLNGAVRRVCVSNPDPDEDVRSYEMLAEVTLASLRERSVRYVFAAAQRISAPISTRYCADTASEYFEVDTGHARKLHGVDMRDILPNFFSKAIQIFNLRDPTATLTADPDLLTRVLRATFEDSQRGLVEAALNSSGTERASLLMSLTPHERAVLLTQLLAGVLLFLHRLADARWSHDALPGSKSLTPAALARHVDEMGRQVAERRELLETIEASTIFTTCNLRRCVAELLVRAIRRAEKLRDGAAGGGHPGAARSPIDAEDDSELEDISLSFANDKGPDVLPCGLSILPLT